MVLHEITRVSLTAIRAHKLRSFLTTLGIVISVWTIVSVVSVISGLNDFVRTRVFSLSPDVFVVTKFGIITSREEFMEALKRKDITEEEASRLGALCQSCGDIGLSLQGSKAVHAGSRRLGGVPINGTSANVAVLQNLDIASGRYFTDSEDEHRAAVAIIGSEVREELFPRLDPIGRTIWIDDVPHEVIGLLVKQGSVLGQSRDLVVYTPFRTAQKQFGRRSIENQISLLVRAAEGIAGVAACQEEVVQVFRWLRHTPFRAPSPVGTVTAEMVQAMFRQVSFSTFIFVFVLSALSLVVGAIVVANIMLVAVIERTREIGLRLALGATKSDIRRQFLLEATLLSALGGAIGSGVGALTAWVVDTQSPMPAQVHSWVVAAAIVTAGMTGIVAGFFPARKAANLPPIEALRHE